MPSSQPGPARRPRPLHVFGPARTPFKQEVGCLAAVASRYLQLDRRRPPHETGHLKPSEGQPKERNKGNRRREIKAFRSKGKQQPQQRQQGKGRTRRPGVGAEKGLSSWSGDSRGRTGSLNPALVRPTRGWEQRGPRTARPSFLSPSCPQRTSTVWGILRSECRNKPSRPHSTHIT